MDIKNFIESLGEKKEELIKKALQCKTPVELLVLAKENGVVLDEEGAQKLFEVIHPKTGQLSDEELDNVAGGSNFGKNGPCINCGAPTDHRGPCQHCGFYYD